MGSEEPIEILHSKIIKQMETIQTDQEINEAVARKLGKLCQYCHRRPQNCLDLKDHAEPYSADIAAAWEVFEFIEVQHNEYSVTVRKLFRSKHGKYSARIGSSAAIADTASMAICLAFLKLP